MKNLIAVIAIFSACSGYACGVNSHAEIDLCTVDDKFRDILKDLKPSYNEVAAVEYSSASVNGILAYSFEPQVYVSGSETLSLHDRLMIDEKPSMAEFEAGLVALKNQLKANFDFRESVDSLDRINRRMVKCLYSDPNAAIFKRDIKNDLDSIKRDCLLSKTAELDAEDVGIIARDKIKKDLLFSSEVTVDFIALIRSGPKDSAKNKRLLSKLSVIQGLLNVGDITSARDDLLNLNADADFSQGAKDLLLGKLNNYLGE